MIWSLGGTYAEDQKENIPNSIFTTQTTVESVLECYCYMFPVLLYLRLTPRGCDTYYAGLQLAQLRPRYHGQHQDWSKEG